MDAELAEVHILDNEEDSRAYIDQLWAEAMTIYNSGNYKLDALPESLQVDDATFVRDLRQTVEHLLGAMGRLGFGAGAGSGG